MMTGDRHTIVGDVLRRWRFELRRRLRPLAPGCFQPYGHTLPDRYPWLFEFARAELAGVTAPRILSFGCSRGDEAFSLHRYFPDAFIKGLDVNPAAIAACQERASEAGEAGLSFATASTTEAEPADHYDAIFCLAVLCHGDLTVMDARRSDPVLHFDAFEGVVGDFARCLKPGGLLLLHTTSFRFCDTAAAAGFDEVLEARPEQMAPDVQFDRDNRRIPGERYRGVAFRKRAPEPWPA
jgi:SAM-dependent methyltransferase